MHPNTNQNLRRLALLRNIIIGGESAALIAMYYFYGTSVSLITSTVTVLIYTAVHCYTWRTVRDIEPVSDRYLFYQIFFDVSILTVLLYLNGGATNPFISLYLVPLAVSAIALPQRYIWIVTTFAVICYTILLFSYRPLPHFHIESAGGFSLHIFGMWFNFLLSAALIAYFLSRIMYSLRERDAILAATREEKLRNERIVALGTLAAGAAHELGTPLSTMAILTKELQHENLDRQSMQESLKTLRDQINHCKQIISRLLTSVGRERVEKIDTVAVDYYLNTLIKKWRDMRPLVKCEYTCEGMEPVPSIIVEHTLSQAIINLLNNAADASSDLIEFHSVWEDDALLIEIRDYGTELDTRVERNAGLPFFTTKENGLGLGLFLSNATIERLGGTLKLFKRKDGKTCTRIKLPLYRLAQA